MRITWSGRCCACHFCRAPQRTMSPLCPPALGLAAPALLLQAHRAPSPRASCRASGRRCANGAGPPAAPLAAVSSLFSLGPPNLLEVLGPAFGAALGGAAELARWVGSCQHWCACSASCVWRLLAFAASLLDPATWREGTVTANLLRLYAAGAALQLGTCGMATPLLTLVRCRARGGGDRRREQGKVASPGPSGGWGRVREQHTHTHSSSRAVDVPQPSRYSKVQASGLTFVCLGTALSPPPPPSAHRLVLLALLVDCACGEQCLAPLPPASHPQTPSPASAALVLPLPLCCHWPLARTRWCRPTVSCTYSL